MEINARNITLGSIAGGIGLVFGTLKVFGLTWADVGWMPPANHAADIAKLEQRIIELEQDTVTGVKDFRDEWKCDEDAEELIELLKAQRAGDDSVETEERIKALRKRMEDNHCGRFDS